MDFFYRDVLDPTSIYAAIDTYDMAIVVREASKALSTRNLHFSFVEAKSKEKSRNVRTLGNNYYNAGLNRHAIDAYNKAIALAPKLSEEMVLAYGNRSAVFLSIKYYTACLKDINRCLAMGCSAALENKLKKRRDDVTPLLFDEYAFNMMTTSELVVSYLKIDKRNADVPCARDDVAFVTREGVKRATAGDEIRTGTVVALERAFVTCPDNTTFLSCYYCHKAELCLYPCEGCLALFCQEECRVRCMKEYHRIECQIVNYLGSMYKNQINILMVRAAIKLSLSMPWDDFITASRDIGALRMRTSTVKQTFSSEEPLSILSYDDDERFLEGRMYNGSILCACILHTLTTLPECYFPKEGAKREAAVDAMARVMLKLFVTFKNRITILNSAFDFNSKTFARCVHASGGWFSMSSKLTHSCEPNLLVVGLNDSVALVALRNIKAGEELTISYNGHFYDTVLKNQALRRNMLYLETRNMCDCQVCAQNWDRNTATTVKMTKKQAKLFAKFNEAQLKVDYQSLYKSCDVLDAFPVNSTQHISAYDVMREILNQVQSKYYNSVTLIG